MSGVVQREVAAEEAALRLDRWFRRHFPELGHGRLEKLLRTGQVRVDGARAKAGDRLAPGQTIRVPPLGAAPSSPSKRSPPPVAEADRRLIRGAVLYRDDDVIVINKPPGLAVQGGSGTRRHVDAMLGALGEAGGERPRLVHRLDRDTSGVLVLARHARAAARLGDAFRNRRVDKLYWALVVGRPPADRGRIDQALVKRGGAGSERMEAAKEGKRALTDYAVIDRLGDRATWLALRPRTGRTHQLRVHCAALGTPILGDGKYGGADAFLSGEGISRRLHLHARAVTLPRADGGHIRIVAPLPEAMRTTWRQFGFDPIRDDDPFAT